jgi:hypothetical protein
MARWTKVKVSADILVRSWQLQDISKGGTIPQTNRHDPRFFARVRSKASAGPLFHFCGKLGSTMYIVSWLHLSLDVIACQIGASCSRPVSLLEYADSRARAGH